MTESITEIFAYLMTDRDGEGVLAGYEDGRDFFKPLIFSSLEEAEMARECAIAMGNEHKSLVHLVKFDKRELLETLIPSGFQ